MTTDTTDARYGTEAPERLGLRIGALCLIISSIVLVYDRAVAHGDLPTDTGEAALSFVAARHGYPLVHLVDWLGVLAWALGLVALAGTLTRRTAWTLGRLGAASVLVGAAAHVGEFSVDGYALPTLAHEWVTASGAQRADLEHGARLALVIIGGPSLASLVILWGVALPLYGLAVAAEGYSPVLGWAGVLIGVATFVGGAVEYLAPNSFPGAIVYGGGTIVTQLWTLILGIAMWIRGRSVVAAARGRPRMTS